MPAVMHLQLCVRRISRHYRAMVIGIFSGGPETAFRFGNFLYLFVLFLIVCPHLYAYPKNVLQFNKRVLFYLILAQIMVMMMLSGVNGARNERTTIMMIKPDHTNLIFPRSRPGTAGDYPQLQTDGLSAAALACH